MNLLLILFIYVPGPNTKFFKKCQKNAGKMKGKIIFSPLWFLIKKLDHNSGLQAKNGNVDTKFGPDRFSRFDVYWIQTDKETHKQCIYIMWETIYFLNLIFVVNMSILHIVQLI